jgi:hypothetical protein
VKLGKPSSVINLRNEHLSISISRKNGAILQVENPRNCLKLIHHRASSNFPWRLSFFDLSTRQGLEEERFETFTSKVTQSDEGGEEVDLHWQVRAGLEVLARVKLPPGEPNSYWYVEVHNNTKETIQQLAFPVLRGIGRLVKAPAERNRLVHPVAGGLLFLDPLGTFVEREASGLRHIPYPEGIGAFAQFMGYYAEGIGGFYFACHDPFNTAKEIDFYKTVDHEGMEARFVHKSWEMEPGNSLAIEYPIVVGVLSEGSWEEAAERYREWATAVGEGHPVWCVKGRLEDRVREGKAAKWLAEEVGFCTFGMPSSFDVSPWLEAIHRIAEKPVFHVLGHDWPQWGGASMERMGRLDALFQEAGLRPFHEYSLNELWFAIALIPTAMLGSSKGWSAFFEQLGANWERLPEARWGEVFEEWNTCGPWLPPRTPPLPWFPTRFHPRNIEMIKENGDFFAPFFFDFFAYGHDHEAYGMNRGGPQGWQQPYELIQAAFAKIWMDPTTSYWQDFHAQRDRKIVDESGADGLYYDISAGCGPRWSDRNDLGHPPGYGRWLWEGYANLYERSKEAASAAKGEYVAQGTEMGLENLIPYIDFCQWRAGGLVQGDIELLPFMGLVKQGKAIKLPLFSYLYHEFGPVMMDGWVKLSREFGDIFYLIAAQIALQQGGLVELNYEYSPLERFPRMRGSAYQLMYHTAIYEDREPFEMDPQKAAFLREIALARTEYATRYLAYGKAMKPVRFRKSIPMIEFSWNHYNSIGGRRESGSFLAPCIVQQVWGYKDESLGIVLANLDGDRAIDVEFALHPADYGIKAGGYSIKQVINGDESMLGVWESEEDVSLNITLPARKIVLLEVQPQPGKER